METWESWGLMVMGVARNRKPSSCGLHKVKIRKLRERASRKVLEESWMT